MHLYKSIASLFQFGLKASIMQNTNLGWGRRIFLLTLAEGVDLLFSMAIKYETSANTASKSAILIFGNSTVCPIQV